MGVKEYLDPQIMQEVSHMIFKCQITLADTSINILYFPDSIEIISIKEWGL